MKVSFHEIGGIRTRILGCGDGPPVLLLHPVGFSADVWFRVMPGLGRTMRVVAPDLLGHGFTDLVDPAGRIGHGPILKHLSALVEGFGDAGCSIVGSSFGGQLALWLALAMPARVRRVVVVGSGTALQTEAETAATLGKTLANASRAFDDPTWESCRARLANLCHADVAVHDEIILGQLTAYARAGAAAAYKALLAAMLDVDAARPFRVAERLGAVRAPTLLLWGRDDPRASLARAEVAVGLFPDARLVAFDRCGHLPFLEHPDRFVEATAAFLAEPVPAAAAPA